MYFPYLNYILTYKHRKFKLKAEVTPFYSISNLSRINQLHWVVQVLVPDWRQNREDHSKKWTKVEVEADKKDSEGFVSHVHALVTRFPVLKLNPELSELPMFILNS
jgi:hypothetical protein